MTSAGACNDWRFAPRFTTNIGTHFRHLAWWRCAFSRALAISLLLSDSASAEGTAQPPARRAAGNETDRGSVEGTVLRMPEGTPLPGAQIVINARVTVSDSLGRFRLINLPLGPTELVAVREGFARRAVPIDVIAGASPPLVIRLAPRAVQLDRVLVTAQETPRSAEGGTVTRIGREAIEHVQASSLADILQLLPGQAALNPTVSDVRQSLLRQAPTSTSRDPGPGTDAERANALGTSVVLDGVPVSNNANLQTTLTILNSGPNALPQFSSTAGRGMDLRQFAADNIESVEVIRGVPSARHGDLTAGAILVTSRAGAQRPELRVRANPLTLETSTIAGWARGAEGGLSIDANLVRSQDDPRSTLGQFTRATTQLTGTARLTPTLRATLRLRGYAVLDEAKRDPNDLRLQRTTRARDRGGRADVRLQLGDPTTRGWLTEFTASISYAEQVGLYRELITRDIFPLTGARRDTIAPGVFGRSEYLTQLTVDGRPLNGYARLESRTDWSRGLWRHAPLVGLELRYDDNRGAGRLFDALTPPRQNYGVGDRPNDFSSIPALTQLAPYAEHRVRTLLFGRAADVRVGARLDLVDPRARGGAAHGAQFAPRTSAQWQLLRTVALRGGWGITSKAPTLSQLYPLPRYFDLISFNYYPPVPSERLVVFTTRVVDPRSAGLHSATTRKVEGALDWSAGGANASMTWFSEQTTGAFGTSRVPIGLLVPQYRATTFRAGAPPLLDPTPFRVDSFVALYDTPRNTRRIATRGVEWTADAPEWRALRTQLSLTGAWFNTRATDDDVEIPVEQFISGVTQPLRVGVYEAGRGSESSRILSSLRLVHRVPTLGLVASVLWQTTWRDDDRPLGRLDGVPLGYVDRSGTVTALTPAQASLPEFASLRRQVLPLEGRWERRPPLHLVNLRLTKMLPGNTQMALFANNALADRPLYQRRRQIGFERRNQPLFFGVEFLSTLALSTSARGS
jgi:hypothetical protein